MERMMPEMFNPFEYDAANNLSDEMIADYYIDDFNYARFIKSKRNIFLIGERGSGKTMALLFNSWRLQKLIAEKEKKEATLETIGVYIPCNTPLTHKTEYQLLENFQASVISEHFLVLAIAYAFADTMSEIPDVLDGADEDTLREEASFVFGDEIPGSPKFFEGIKQFIQRQLRETQKVINSQSLEVYYENAFSFASVVLPLINITRAIPKLKKSHFLLMIDDAHALNEFQMQSLNSWIAYRDHSVFSFKVALAKVGRQVRKTSSGGSILEGHDFTRIDLEEPYQNKDSDFYHLAEKLISRRLKNSKINITPDEFFPMSTSMQEALAKSEKVIRAQAIEKFGAEATKPITDYVYKYKRVHYFRSRDAKANRPPYSGFKTLVFLSTGVVRNLLEPCYWMYDKEYSKALDKHINSINEISSSVQTEIILERSQRLWDWVRGGLDQDIEGCSREDGKHAYQLLDNLAIYFRHRLLNNKSEPSAVSFSISEQQVDVMENLNHVIEILQKAQLIYTRSGPAKEKGKREIYYEPNRMLWPDRGLDPQGQHASASLRAKVLWQAALHNKLIPTNKFKSASDAQGMLPYE